MMRSDVIAVDWGTTNRRVYRLSADGTVRHLARDGRGILAVRPGGFVAEVVELRRRYGGLPTILAGMVGSVQGWMETPYVPAPAGLVEIAASVSRLPGDIFILPGISHFACDGRADVMRGEEVQLLGAVAAGLVPAQARLCQPGTHCKWANLAEPHIVDFTTAMTGELFALLRQHSLLASMLIDPPEDGDAFGEGLEDARRNDLAGALFGVRAAALLGRRTGRDAASYVSGLLIGSDTSAHVVPGESVYILADGALGELYVRAIEAASGSARIVDSQAAFVAGITALREYLL